MKEQLGELLETVKTGGKVFDGHKTKGFAPIWNTLLSSRRLCKVCLAVPLGKPYSAFETDRKALPMTDFVSYVRVSTKKQAASGLGLEAQRDAVARHVDAAAGNVIKEFQEVESGKRSDRPQLAKALAFAKRNGAVLVVAKLDRLSRNVAFLSALMESGVDFVACDNPHANRFTLHILAAVAEHEREMISKRTREAMAAAKRTRGQIYGSARPEHWKGRESRRIAGARAGNRRSAQIRREAAIKDYADLVPRIKELRDSGSSLRQIAEVLNNEGERTRRGCRFAATQVRAILERAAA